MICQHSNLGVYYRSQLPTLCARHPSRQRGPLAIVLARDLLLQVVGAHAGRHGTVGRDCIVDAGALLQIYNGKCRVIN